VSSLEYEHMKGYFRCPLLQLCVVSSNIIQGDVMCTHR